MSDTKRFIVVHIADPRVSNAESESELQEITSLINTYGGATIIKIIQKRDFPDNDTYIGKGKSEELKSSVKSEKADVVVLNAIVKPGQVFNLKRFITDEKENVEVWDRVDLILQIFSKHAQTAEAKLQIELAMMRHMGPRIYGLGGTLLSRQGGGIGTRGIGETNSELMKRHWRDQIKNTQDKLKRLVTEREKQIQRRKEIGLTTISIVGYTNAGKSSLFNTLTKKKKLVEDALFATLDSAVGELYLPTHKKTVLISDTIGFIKNLPPKLIDAFKSTLLESVHADMLIHVIDGSDEKIDEKIQTVETILSELNTYSIKKIYVFNKADLIPDEKLMELKEKYQNFEPLFISVNENAGIINVVQRIESLVK